MIFIFCHDVFLVHRYTWMFDKCIIVYSHFLLYMYYTCLYMKRRIKTLTAKEFFVEQKFTQHNFMFINTSYSFNILLKTFKHWNKNIATIHYILFHDKWDNKPSLFHAHNPCQSNPLTTKLPNVLFQLYPLNHVLFSSTWCMINIIV